jgi:adenosyl cobinamide kinase/adenosyl cobinamide phosphate guanylyltransferase
MTRTLTLILGGARSGKSTHALSLAASAGRVLFVATAESGDAEMAERIAAHRRGRPTTWDTLEEPRALAASLARAGDRHDVVVIDCLTLWVSNLMAVAPSRPVDPASWVDPLLAAYRGGTASWIVVSNEVGLGIVPATSLGRAYRDALGAVNRLVAAAADTVTLMVAGLPLTIKGAR